MRSQARLKPAAFLALAGVIAAASVAWSQGASRSSVWFSAAQAVNGQRLEALECAGCHGLRLEGRYGPPLAGVRFLERWRGRTALEMERIIADRMPLGGTQHPSQTERLELIAFVLQSNGFPSGEQELRPESLEKIRF